MMFLKVALSLFLSGAIFLFTLYRVFGAPLKLTLKKGMLAFLLSIVFNGISVNVHHGYMGLSQTVLFDCVSLVVIAVLSACVVAAVLCLLPRKSIRRILMGKKRETHIKVLKPQTTKYRAA